MAAVNSDAAISIEGVRFAYGAAPGRAGRRSRPDGAGADEVLRGVSLTVERGTIMCLMGVNGCGKSTLIDCVLRVHEPQAGTIGLLGRDARSMDAPELARVASYVPQVHERSFPYTVEHVVLMGRLAHVRGLGAPDGDDRALARAALARCGMAHLIGRSYTGLSGGEMQMVMLARALAQDAPIVLMDEPTAHLDFRNELLFLETVERLVRDEGATVLMATHAPDQAFHLQAAGVPVQVALMSEGRVVRQGSPDAVLDARALMEVFGVEGIVAEVAVPALPGGVLRRVVPLRSLSETAVAAACEAVSGADEEKKREGDERDGGSSA